MDHNSFFVSVKKMNRMPSDVLLELRKLPGNDVLKHRVIVFYRFAQIVALPDHSGPLCHTEFLFVWSVQDSIVVWE